jgi:hypothetical protein
MTDIPLRPATPDELAETLTFSLQYNGRKRVHDADLAMARITADRLVRHLEASGFRVMKIASAPTPTISNRPPSEGDQDE